MNRFKTNAVNCAMLGAFVCAMPKQPGERIPAADLPLGANRRERSASSCRTASAHRALALDGFDSLPFFQKQKQHPDGMLFCFGAGYGNRTRLCGLGSDHSTDELTLHCRYYSRWGRKNQCLFCRRRISLLSGKMQPFVL